MARVAVEIPKVGLVMETVRVLRWLRQPGDTIAAGEPLLEVETEKSTVEIESTASGRLQEILAPVDTELQVGDRVAWVETDAAQPAAAAPPAPALTPPAAATPTMPPAVRQEARARGALEGLAARVRATPYARRLAAERGLGLHGIRGSGPGGRIESRDLPPPAAAAGGEPLAPMRRALARAMSLSNATVPQFTVERSFDCSAVQALRVEHARGTAGSPPLSINDFLLQAIARTLIEQPELNATFAGDAGSANARLVRASGAHIGLVVAVDGGLLVPVIHDAEKAGLIELARRRQACVRRALEGKLRGEELEGATFSLSNLGQRGPDRFTALINPPQSAILAVGRQRDCVVASGGGFELRPQSVLTLSVDHRVADGRAAALFVARLVEILEGRDWNFSA